MAQLDKQVPNFEHLGERHTVAAIKEVQIQLDQLLKPEPATPRNQREVKPRCQLRAAETNETTPHARLWNILRRNRERLADAIFEQNWLVGVRYRLMHDSFIAVLLNVCTEALEWTAPRYRARLLGRDSPIAETIEVFFSCFGLLNGCEVDEGVTKPCCSVEVHGQVEEVVASLKTLIVEELEQFALGVAIGDIAQQESCLEFC